MDARTFNQAPDSRSWCILTILYYLLHLTLRGYVDIEVDRDNVGVLYIQGQL